MKKPNENSFKEKPNKDDGMATHEEVVVLLKEVMHETPFGLSPDELSKESEKQNNGNGNAKKLREVAANSEPNNSPSQKTASALPSFSKVLADTKTVAQLREIAKQMGLKTAGTQAALIDRLIAAGYAG